MAEVRAGEYKDRGCQPMMLFWYVEEGECVQEGQDLCEVESARGAALIQAPANGTLVEICVHEAEPVTSGQLLGRIEPVP